MKNDNRESTLGRIKLYALRIIVYAILIFLCVLCLFFCYLVLSENSVYYIQIVIF